MRDLIVFGEDFGGLPSSTQHLVRHLAKQHKVLWVNSIGLRQPRLSVKDITRAFNKLTGRSNALTQNMLDPQNVAQHELELIEKSDLIFAASEKLMDKFPSEKAQLLPHGVDVGLFSTPVPRAHDLPSNHRPIAGFYGSLSEWLDYDMVKHVATAMPEWDFVFIGPNELDTLSLPNLENVHYLGPRPHHTLPSYSQHWDVSLLPFVDNEQIRACSPLKLMEYLAAGTPIVTTPFPAMVPYNNHVTSVENAQQMVEALEQSRHLENSPVSVVSKDSWQNRGNFVHWMLELL